MRRPSPIIHVLYMGSHGSSVDTHRPTPPSFFTIQGSIPGHVLAFSLLEEFDVSQQALVGFLQILDDVEIDLASGAGTIRRHCRQGVFIERDHLEVPLHRGVSGADATPLVQRIKVFDGSLRTNVLKW
jgi:hypothetical protein